MVAKVIDRTFGSGLPDLSTAISSMRPYSWLGLAVADADTGAPLGFAQPLLYPLLGTASFHDISTGDNGSYKAGPGWDPCTGLGSPDGTALATALGSGASGGAGASGGTGASGGAARSGGAGGSGGSGTSA